MTILRYHELARINREEFNKLPLFFAFSAKQRQDVPPDSIQVGAGGWIRKEDKHLLEETMTRIEQRTADFMATDEGMLDALKYELANHEYCITYDPEDTLEALGFDYEDERVQRLLPIAIKQYLETCCN